MSDLALHSATSRPMLFSDRLATALEAKKSPVVVGIDPHLDRFPSPLRQLASSTDRKLAAAAIQRFVDELLEAIADTVAIVKPQVAFFERLGPPGWRALEHTVARAHELGLLVLADAKRGDIGSTATAYADYFFGDSGLGADALTVNAYLGSDSLAPFVSYVTKGKGLFVLAKTSNSGSKELQDLTLEGSEGTEPVYSQVGHLADKLGTDSVGELGYSSIGLVVGATSPQQAATLRGQFPRLPFLVPGYGAQGGSAEDVVAAFDDHGRGAIVNASRSILFAYATPEHEDLGPERWAEASRRECIAMRDAIRAALAAHR